MKTEAVKRKVFEIIEPGDNENAAGKIFDVFIIALVIINTVLIITETFYDFEQFKNILHVIEIFTVVIFTIEYILRIWTADMRFPDKNKLQSRIKYIFSFMALIDLFAILPFYTPFILPHAFMVIRSLRIIRLLRLFKVNRYTIILSTIGNVFRKKASQLIVSMSIVFLLMLITSVLMYNVEHMAQPDKFTNAFSSLWWTISTVTTVGYGDIYPITVAGQILSGIISFLGIGLIAIPTGIISAGFIEQAGQAKDNSGDGTENKCFCPYCGHKLDE